MIQWSCRDSHISIQGLEKPQFQNTRKGLFCSVNSDLVIIKLLRIWKLMINLWSHDTPLSPT